MRFFPPNIGLDISETSLKAVGLKQAEGGLFSLEAFGKEYFPEGSIVGGEVKSSSTVLGALKSILENKDNGFTRTKYIVASLPEEKTFTRILEMPAALKEKELAEALKWEIESNLPVSLDEVYFDSEILNRDISSGHCDILVNAVPKRIVDSYISCFNDNGYHLLGLEVESVSAHRALFGGESPVREAVLVMDIGALKTRFMIVAEGILRFTSSNSVAGDKFSQILAQQFPVNIKEAEFMKRVVGLDKDQQKGRELLEALKPGLMLLNDQIQNYVSFFETHPSNDHFHESARKISKIILTGGGAGLWGLVDWLSQELKLPVVLGDSLKRVKSPHSKKNMALEESLAYTTAIGLALRSFEELEKS